MLSPAREAAYRILRQVESGRGFATDLLQGSHISKLKEVDRSLATELVMGTLRRRGQLDLSIEHISNKPLKYFDPEILTVLRMGVYQIRFLQRIPKSAVVDEAVKMAKAARKASAAGLVNAVLRKCPKAEGAAPRSREGTQPSEPDTYGALRAVPEWLAGRWKLNFGEGAAIAIAQASLRVPPTALRIRAEGAEPEPVRVALAQEGVVARRSKYFDRTLLVESGSAHTLKEVYEGRLVIQDEASQLLGSLLSPNDGDRVLDLCAAPGIKTGQIAGALHDGMLVACDVSASRLRTMGHLLSKQPPLRVRLHRVQLDASRELPFAMHFDRILLDAPCSGTGTLARNPEIKWRLCPADISRLAEVQSHMLEGALRVLAPGGRIVYATCSLEPEENEQVVEKVLAERKDYQLLSRKQLASQFPALSSFFDLRGYFRTRPDLDSMDGFFAAIIVRPKAPPQRESV